MFKVQTVCDLEFFQLFPMLLKLSLIVCQFKWIMLVLLNLKKSCFIPVGSYICINSSFSYLESYSKEYNFDIMQGILQMQQHERLSSKEAC